MFSKAPRTNIIFNFGVSPSDISNPKRSQKQAFLKKTSEKNPLENISECVHGWVWILSRRRKICSCLNFANLAAFVWKGFIFTSRRLNVSQQREPIIKRQAASQWVRIKHLSQLKKPPSGFIGHYYLYSRNSFGLASILIADVQSHLRHNFPWWV